MSIYATQMIHGPQGISAPHRAESVTKPAETQTKQPAVVEDKLEISSQAQGISSTSAVSANLSGAEIRLDKVNEARARIASGYYDNPEIFEAAMTRLVEKHFG